MGEFFQVQTTFGRREDADRCGATLVERGYAACAQVLGPLASTYRWRGQVETSEEWLCLIKTSRKHYRQVEQAIIELHPYETPQIIALPIAMGSAAYLAWVAEQTSSKG